MGSSPGPDLGRPGAKARYSDEQPDLQCWLASARALRATVQMPRRRGPSATPAPARRNMGCRVADELDKLFAQAKLVLA